MLTDYHSHILPGMDDGAKDAAMSRAMLGMLKGQGVKRLIATPHFYAHRERSVAEFLGKRQSAYEQIAADASDTEILLGAEIAVEHDISEKKGIEQLAVQGTDLILLELPYAKFSPWMTGEIYNIRVEYKLRPVVAHIHRYLDYYTDRQMEQVLELPVIFQINNEAFSDWKQARFVKRLLKSDLPVVFGSDCHNLTNRRPNWDLLRRKCRAEIIGNSDNVLEQHRTLG